MANLLNYIKTLYDQELYSNVTYICNLTLTISEQKPNYLTFLGKFQVIMYYADALYYTQQYAQADNYYRQALQVRKIFVNKSKTPNNKLIENQNEITGEVDIKFKIHLCCLALKQRKDAADILQSIPARQRTPKVYMALGNIYKEVGMERSAITCFKEVLRECPLALEALESLLKLGVNGAEVNSLVITVSTELPWVNFWIKAQAQLHSRDYSNAIQTYKSMDTHGLLKDNTSLLVNMGYCYHYMCEDAKAIAVLQKAMRIDLNLISGRDLLSTLLSMSGNKDYQQVLENLCPTSDTSLWSMEHWVILGNLMYFLKRYEKAAYFAQQALMMDKGKNVEASLLKANALIQLKKYDDASIHAIEALQMCPYRYDTYKCMVECYIHANRLREAESVALTACKELNYSANAYCLHASCLLKDPMASTKNIRRILERAIAQDKRGSTNALYMLVELLEKEQQYEQAAQVLLKALESQKPSSRIHQLLGDCYVNLQKDEEAFKYYTTALKLDPHNQRATEGLNSIGRNVPVTQYNPRRANSDHEADPESDTDLWPGSSPSY